MPQPPDRPGSAANTAPGAYDWWSDGSDARHRRPDPSAPPFASPTSQRTASSLKETPAWRRLLGGPGVWSLVVPALVLRAVVELAPYPWGVSAWWAADRPSVWDGHWWTWLTHLWLAPGLWVIAIALFVIFFGRSVDRRFGAGRLWLLFLLTGVAASAARLLAHDAEGIGVMGFACGAAAFCGVADSRLGSERDSPGLFVGGILLAYGLFRGYLVETVAAATVGALLALAWTSRAGGRGPDIRLRLPATLAITAAVVGLAVTASVQLPGQTTGRRGVLQYDAAVDALRVDDYQRALELVREARRQGIDLVEAWQMESWLLHREDRYDEAREVVTDGLQRYPDDPSLILDRGILRGLDERYADALADIDRALTLAPEDWSRREYALRVRASLPGQSGDLRPNPNGE